MDFHDRMFLNSEAVYAAIQRGELQGPDQVEAALHDAQLDASTDEN